MKRKTTTGRQKNHNNHIMNKTEARNCLAARQEHKKNVVHETENKTQNVTRKKAPLPPISIHISLGKTLVLPQPMSYWNQKRGHYSY